EPANYKAALLDPESDKWLNAMNVEVQSIKDNEVWDLDELPPNGRSQTLWIDYEETFSLVTDIRAIRILIAIDAFDYYEIWKMDIKTAFLNGYLSEEVYMEQPKELKVSCYTDVGYLTDADDLKSQAVYVFVLNGGAVDWKSAKQIIFATSSAEAKYIATFDASKEAVRVRNSFMGLVLFPQLKNT
nr:putative retrotransposon Ty1-copia subclass protein [Tanacetum cinerariifolium]